MLTGENGILKQAQEAKKATKRASIIEQAQLDILGKQTEKNGGDITAEELEVILKKYFSNEEENLKNIINETTSEGEETLLIAKGDSTIKIDLSEIYNGNITEEVNTNPTLTKKWVSKIDGNGEEEFLDVEKTSDGGYIAVGYTTSTDIAGLTNKGSADCLIAKYDANGNEQWKKSVGGSKYDWYNSVIEITDGTYIAVGTILSIDVLDKSGNNIGHGYDWEFENNPSRGSMVASEGIIGTYDKRGNEISLITTGEAYEDAGGVWSNVILLGIDVVEDKNYMVFGKELVGLPSGAPFEDDLMNQLLAIKYTEDNEKVCRTETLLENQYSNLIGGRSSDGIIEDCKDDTALAQAFKGTISLGENCIIYGGARSPAGGTGLWKSSNDLKNVSEVGYAFNLVKNCFLDKQSNYITLNYNARNMFMGVEKQSDSSKIWDYTDKVIKSISKRNEESFVGISEDNKFLVYDMNDGNVLNEYEIPTYENIHAIEGEDEFILLGSPANEEGITITGTSGAVIAKYAIE